MSYTVILLDDDINLGPATQRDIGYRDPNAKVLLTRTVEEAKEQVRKHKDIAYVVVDLLMLQSQDKQGRDFITWLFEDESRARLPIFVISIESIMIDELKRILRAYPQRKVTITKRTWDYEEKVGAKLSEFIGQINNSL